MFLDGHTYNDPHGKHVFASQSWGGMDSDQHSPADMHQLPSVHKKLDFEVHL